MTLITLQDGKVVFRDGAVGTEQACCCDVAECEGDEDCPEGECCVNGTCSPCPCESLADCSCSDAGEGWSDGGFLGSNFTCCPPGTFYAADDFCECYDPDCPEYPGGGRQAILDFEAVQCCQDGVCAPSTEACPP